MAIGDSMDELVPYLITSATLVLTGIASLTIAIALLSARRSRLALQRRSRRP